MKTAAMASLAHREPAELADQIRFPVVDVVQHERVIDRDADRMVLSVHLRDEAGRKMRPSLGRGMPTVSTMSMFFQYCWWLLVSVRTMGKSIAWMTSKANVTSPALGSLRATYSSERA